ncbi:hypothetical protein CVD25_13330 [Bacillus canaveralius]|uniref:Uncharacterized protein n=1 Tax=Bacillus canaveralius TaxID=1403243 RepID=A0A2N5GGM2_9BACI|nr:hypothetical protein CU635_20610 [Bacillus canaveralius]PLR80426.1 hypothetical protein CVD23_21080 [Bacillus sp. V33-4]PLR96029.1 hypothetical protein CVD25_13330 [Bacillus canaveralius]
MIQNPFTDKLSKCGRNSVILFTKCLMNAFCWFAIIIYKDYIFADKKGERFVDITKIQSQRRSKHEYHYK